MTPEQEKELLTLPLHNIKTKTGKYKLLFTTKDGIQKPVALIGYSFRPFEVVDKYNGTNYFALKKYMKTRGGGFKSRLYIINIKTGTVPELFRNGASTIEFRPADKSFALSPIMSNGNELQTTKYVFPLEKININQPQSFHNNAVHTTRRTIAGIVIPEYIPATPAPTQSADNNTITVSVIVAEPQKKKRGRPKGSKNKKVKAAPAQITHKKKRGRPPRTDFYAMSKKQLLSAFRNRKARSLPIPAELNSELAKHFPTYDGALQKFTGRKKTTKTIAPAAIKAAEAKPVINKSAPSATTAYLKQTKRNLVGTFYDVYINGVRAVANRVNAAVQTFIDNQILAVKYTVPGNTHDAIYDIFLPNGQQWLTQQRNKYSGTLAYITGVTVTDKGLKLTLSNKATVIINKSDLAQYKNLAYIIEQTVNQKQK